MKIKYIASTLLLIVSSGAFADCNVKKAARNAAMDSKIGVSGRCDAKKATKDAVDNTLNISEKKETVNQKVENVKDKTPDVHHRSKTIKK